MLSRDALEGLTARLRAEEERLAVEARQAEERLALVRQALAGIEAALRLPPELTDGPPTPPPLPAHRGRAVRAALLQVIEDGPGPFTAPQLWREVRRRFPEKLGTVHRSTINAVLQELVARRRIQELRKPKARRAGLYARNERRGGASAPGR